MHQNPKSTHQERKICKYAIKLFLKESRNLKKIEAVLRHMQKLHFNFNKIKLIKLHFKFNKIKKHF